MTTTSYKPGDVIDVVLGATATAGSPILVGNLLAVPITGGSSGDTIACEITGQHTLAKVSGGGTAWTAGAPLYWDAGASKVTYTANSGANKRIGSAVFAAADGATTGVVLLGHF